MDFGFVMFFGSAIEHCLKTGYGFVFEFGFVTDDFLDGIGTEYFVETVYFDLIEYCFEYVDNLDYVAIQHFHYLNCFVFLVYVEPFDFAETEGYIDTVAHLFLVEYHLCHFLCVEYLCYFDACLLDFF